MIREHHHGHPGCLIGDVRILYKVNPASGDLRPTCELFGIKVETALRYLPDPQLGWLDDGVVRVGTAERR